MADYNVVSPPKGLSYAAPLVGFQIGEGLADIPDSYFAGKQIKRKLELQKPILDPATGQVTTDPSVMVPELMKRGGAEYAQDYVKIMLPYMLQAQADALVADVLGGNQPGTTRPAVPGIGQGQPQQQPQQQPTRVTVGPRMAQEGETSIRSLATELGGGRDVSPLISDAARTLRINPDAPLAPEQVSQVRSLLNRSLAVQPTGGGQRPQVMSADGQNGAPQPASNAASGAPAPTGQGPETALPATGVAPRAGGSGAPPFATTEGQRLGERPVQQAQAQPPVPAVRTDPTLGGLVPQKWIDNGGTAQSYRDSLAQLAARPLISKSAQAAALERMKAIDALIGKNAELTGPQKESRDPAVAQFEAKKEYNKNLIAQSQKTYNGMQAASTQYERDMKPMLTLSKSILNRPEIYTGPLGNRVLDFNRIKTVFGDQQAAVLQEALQKVTAVSVLGQINQQRDQLMEAGGASARIFKEQVSLVEKAAPQLLTTVYGNRFLVNVADRVGDLSTKVTDMARQYMSEKERRGDVPVLDHEFDAKVSDYLRKNPIFTKQEMADPRILGAPTAPETIKTEQEAKAWASSMGLKRGDPFYLPNGKIKYSL
jgi:hypothetical protein